MSNRFFLLRSGLIFFLIAASASIFAQTNQLPLIFTDTTREVVLVGTVRSFNFSSPETIIEVEVESSATQTSVWRVITKSATELRRLGWSSQSLSVGELVQVDGELVPGSRLSVQLDKLVRANGQQLRPSQESVFDQLVSGTYLPVTSQSSIQLSFDRYGYSRSIFYFNNFDAQLELNAEQISASKFQLDLLTEDLSSGSFELTRILKSGVFFDASNFPVMSISTTSIEPLDNSSLLVRANLTIKGITQAVEFKIQLNQSGQHPESGLQTIGFSGVGQLNRADWGFLSYLPEIGNQILVELQMEFELTAGNHLSQEPASYPYNQL